jgi:FkbM family methyltransferase
VARQGLRYPRKTVLATFGIQPSEPQNGARQEEPSDVNYPPDIFTRLPISHHRTPLGNYYLPLAAPNDIVAAEMRAGRVFEPHVLEVAKIYAKPGTLVLDLGANFGQMSILFSRLVGEKGMVLSFEAQAYCFAILHKNITANKAENIRAFYGAVMEKGGGEVSFPEPDLVRFPSYGSYPLSLKKADDVQARVPTLSIDELQIDFPISFLKVDTQGSDIFVLRGARETVCRHRMPILFEYEERFQEEFGTCFQDYVDFAQSVGYRFTRTIADINYLILPDPAKMISTPPPLRANRGDFITVTAPPFTTKLCKFLKTESEVEDCTAFLHRNGYVSHDCTCKDWDLAHIIPHIGAGNVLDMGSSDSHILKNCNLKRNPGKKYGIDFRKPSDPLQDVTYFEGTLLQTPLPDGHLNYITCLSVIEHQVDHALFAQETSRLLAPGGKLFVTFDYWDPLLQIPIKLYDLEWQPLDRPGTENLIRECGLKNLKLVDEVDWTLQDQVVRWGYYSPHREVSYTFGLLVFEKGE